MSSYMLSPNGGGVTRASHVGGAQNTPDGVPHSKYPSTATMHGGRPGWSAGEIGSKLYPYTTNFVLGMPLFVRPYHEGISPLRYTPPS
jgi:hypothetical protein